MVDPVVVREWLQKAEEDYRFAEANLRAQEGFYPQICFHFHQAAEKYLKSCIVAFELEFKKTHDLVQLLDVCMERRPVMGGGEFFILALLDWVICYIGVNTLCRYKL